MKYRKRDFIHKNPRALFLALLVFLSSPFLQAATSPNTQIINTAIVTSSHIPASGLLASAEFTVSDNSPSIIEFMQLSGSETDPSDTINLPFRGAACSSSANDAGPFTTNTLRRLTGQVLTAGDNLNLVDKPGAFFAGDILFVQVTDYDKNLDSTAIERVFLTITNINGDREVIQLTETYANSGKFFGGIQTAAGARSIGNCLLDVGRGDSVSANYTDAEHNTDSVLSITLIDPFGVVFDSLNGTRINGVTIRLFSQATGQLAEVYSPNGIDRWPSTVVTGNSVTDSSNAVFPMLSGEYRFPRVAAGFYYFEIDVPEGFVYPSVRSNPELQSLPGAPYVLLDASRGAVFEVPPGPDVQVDIPFDPIEGELFLQKTVSSNVAAVGDFLSYNISVKNSEPGTLTDLVIEDELPRGFRLQTNSLSLNGSYLEPNSISADGQTFEIAIGNLAAGQSASISYVVEITSGAVVGEAINRAQSISRLATSNVAEASVIIKNELFSNNVFLLGRVYEGSCDAAGDTENVGISGVRIYLEEGKSVTTDAEGRWHIDGVSAGTHIIRLDEESLSGDYELVECGANSRNFRSPSSSFVNLAEGSLWNQDFVVERVSNDDNSSRLVDELLLDQNMQGIDQMPAYDPSWLGSDGFEILWPEQGYTPRFRAIRIAIKHDRSEKVDLILNGEPVSPLNRRDTITNPIFSAAN